MRATQIRLIPQLKWSRWFRFQICGYHSYCLYSSSLHSERSSLSILSPVFLSQVNKLFERSANIYFSLVAKKLVSSSPHALPFFQPSSLSPSHTQILFLVLLSRPKNVHTHRATGFEPSQEKRAHRKGYDAEECRGNQGISARQLRQSGNWVASLVPPLLKLHNQVGSGPPAVHSSN